jgi:hypothetical protein
VREVLIEQRHAIRVLIKQPIAVVVTGSVTKCQRRVFPVDLVAVGIVAAFLRYARAGGVGAGTVLVYVEVPVLVCSVFINQPVAIAVKIQERLQEECLARRRPRIQRSVLQPERQRGLIMDG